MSVRVLVWARTAPRVLFHTFSTTMVDFLSIGRKAGKIKTKRHGGGDTAGGATMPFRWLRIFDDSAGKPATPLSPALGVKLLEIDLTGSTWNSGGLATTLGSTLTGTVLALGLPLYMRCVSDDGLTATDTDWKPKVDATSPSTELAESDPPDDAVVHFPGVWLPDTPVEFDPGDLVFTP